MVESRDELLMEITRETRLDRMGEDEDEEEEDTDDEGDVVAPPSLHRHPQRPLLSYQKRSTKRALWRLSLRYLSSVSIMHS
jgi:hypothetical protein